VEARWLGRSQSIAFAVAHVKLAADLCLRSGFPFPQSQTLGKRQEPYLYGSLPSENLFFKTQVTR